MPLDIEEGRANNVPSDSTLVVKVSTSSTNVNATGRLDLPSGSVTQWSHGKIVNRTLRTQLTATGRHFARVTVIVPATTIQKATVEFSIEDGDGTTIRTFKPEFSGKTTGNDIYLGRAKWIVSVV